MTTILHVEDDESLAEMVATAFEAFGFRGATMTATTVEEARAVLGDLVRYPTIDLIISDMQLPDGTGLDVVRAVRSNPSRAHIPILMLSGETDPEKINRAYALGASSYINKLTRGRSVSEMVRALHDHWLKDVRLPTPSRAVRTRDLLATSVQVRTRKAKACMNIAEQFGLGDARAEFWTDLALREGNLASLISFLWGQLGERELSEQCLAELAAIQACELRTLDQLENQPLRTPEEAHQYLLRIVFNATSNAAPLARGIGELFPIAPVAITALHDVAARSLEDVAAWIEMNARDPQLRDQAPRLRAGAKQLRKAASA